VAFGVVVISLFSVGGQRTRVTRDAVWSTAMLPSDPGHQREFIPVRGFVEGPTASAAGEGTVARVGTCFWQLPDPPVGISIRRFSGDCALFTSAPGADSR